MEGGSGYAERKGGGGRLWGGQGSSTGGSPSEEGLIRDPEHRDII